MIFPQIRDKAQSGVKSDRSIALGLCDKIQRIFTWLFFILKTQLCQKTLSDSFMLRFFFDRNKMNARTIPVKIMTGT